MKMCALAVAIAAAMTFSAVSLAGARTTAPSKKITILVVINDAGITVHTFAGVLVHGDPEEGALMQLPGPVPRGDYMSFNIYNRGKNVHNFTIFGKQTSSIKPGGKAHLFSVARSRGNFLYQSTLDKSKKSFRGYFTIY
jgi:hypothetical protein